MFCFACYWSWGGLLIAIPKGVVSEEALLDANLLEDDGIVGPSKEFEAELLEEPEEGAPFRTGVRCPFLVLDVSAEVLPLLREYDPVTDMHEVVRPFSEDRPQDLPEVRDVLEEVTLWISSITDGRLNFYSAREEPVPTASSKKPAPKRITNNQIASQLAALAAQVQLLASQQEVMQKAQNAKSSDHLAPSAGHVPDRGLGIYPTSKIPALSASLGAVPQTTAKQLTGLIGPPPNTKSLAEVPNVPSVDPPAELGSTPLQAPESSDMQNIVSAISQQSLAITHLVSHLTSGDAIADLQSGGSTGVSTSTKGVARRERMQADLASRSSSYFLQVQQQNVQENVPCQGSPFQRRGDQDDRSFHDSVLRTVRWIPCSAGTRFDGLDCWTCYGCSCIRRLRPDKGVHWDFGSLPRTVDNGWQLECGLCPQHVGRTSHPSVLGSYADFEWDFPAICTFGTAGMGCNYPELSQGGRTLTDKESGSSEQSPAHCKVSSRSVKPLGCSESQAQTKVSQEACCPSRWGRKVISHDGDVPVSSRACMGASLIEKAVNEGEFDSDSRPAVKPRVFESSKKQPLKGPAHRFPNSDDTSLSYPKWCAMLVSEVLKTRTSFSAFVVKSFKTLRSPVHPEASTLTLFPVSLPEVWVGRMPEACSSKKRHSIHLSRAVFVIVCALNFWYAGGRSIDVSTLRRVPNSMHRNLFQKVRNLIKSDGLATSFSLPKSGRKFPELIGRLGELSSFLTALGVSSNPYEKAYAGVEVPKDDTKMPELQPFHDLDPDRLQLYGTGSWQIKDFLSDDLLMPFMEPLSIRSGIDLGDRPCIRDSAETVGKLAKIWDSQGLLLLHDESVPKDGLTRIFNAYKGPLIDRQIGDRRGLNSLESKVPGPSSSLPSGVDVSELYAHPKRQTLAVSITDRRDFYHQISVSRSKAIGNTVGPPVPLHLVSSTKAFQNFCARGKRRRYNRESDGDAFNANSDHPSLLVPPPEDHLWVSFDSVLQGDHIGVEVATDGHRNLLQSFGLLDDYVCLTADKPLRSSTELQGRCIDDFSVYP